MHLHYSEQGQGRPVILLHGLFGTGSNLGALARDLAADYRAILPDQRNHGRSPWSDEMTYPAMADDLATFMQRLSLDSAALVGHSMGGKVAMQLALTHPRLVEQLIIADIAPVAYGHGHENVLAGLRLVSDSKPSSRSEGDKMLANSVEEAGTRQFLLKSLARQPDGSYDWQINWRVVEAQYDHLAAAVSGEAFHGPTLFIKGSESAYIREAHQQAVLELFPKAKLKVIQGAGHWLHADKPHSFNRLVRQALADCQPGN